MKSFFRELLNSMNDGFKVILVVLGYLIGVFVTLTFCGCSTSKKVDVEKRSEYYEQDDLDKVVREWESQRKSDVTFSKDSLWFDYMLISTKYDPVTNAVTQVDSARVRGGFFGEALLPKRLKWRKREWTRLDRNERYQSKYANTSKWRKKSVIRGKVLPSQSYSHWRESWV